MKNIARMALAMAVATIACLSPTAHADEAQLIAPTIQQERHYDYYDKDGHGTLVVKDGPKYNWGRPIAVTLYQNGHVFYGEGKRTLTSKADYYIAYCEFWVYGYGISAKFKGYMPVVPDGSGGGKYFLHGSGSPYEWHCYLGD